MTRNDNREEIMRIAAERMRQKREREAREDLEFYQRITSGPQWLLFKIVVFFCATMLVVSLVEQFFDGPSKKLNESSWKIDRTWEYTWHKVLDIEGYMFTPTIGDWSARDEKSIILTYSPIFRTGKKLSYSTKLHDSITVHRVETRQRSIFNWFPAFQVFLLIPIITYLFKRQSPWFNFGRIASLVFVFPGTLMVIFFTLMQ